MQLVLEDLEGPELPAEVAQCLLSLQPGQWRAEAGVDALPERGVPVRPAADVEPVGVSESGRIPVRRIRIGR